MKKFFPWLMLLAAPVVAVLCFMFMMPHGDLLPPIRRALIQVITFRILTGFAVGAALACAGVILQALLRNPLAEPYVLGVSGGAALGAATAIVLNITVLTALAVPFFAFVFAVAALALVYALASHRGSVSVFGLILSGVIVSAMCSSVLMFLISVFSAKSVNLHTITWWMLGSLDVLDDSLLYAGVTVSVLGVLVAWLMSPDLNAITLGRDMAHHVGVRTSLMIPAGLALATLLAATAVSLAGIIGFVGLIVPHVVRSITGADHRRLIPASALAGGIFLVLCDTLARSLSCRAIPIGIVTALFGGPFFLMILRTRGRYGWRE